ncbi:hypothetical protein POM88_026727 [Heracleum sosnowskyi]|uniref:DUF4005 domain-containing protein n=1 Tax=Heracleum sosnowskyi TaxID=360622 RepID=A0AAD8MQC6_9APIA|nr:hypothetical protein POM88_026727 [Heracleum sosnowskyi]
MGKASKWIKNFLTGKKSSSHQPIPVDANHYAKTPISNSLTSSKDKRRWSFRKTSNTVIYQHELNVVDTIPNMQATLEAENEQKRHALSVAVATAATADAAAKAANEALMRLTNYSSSRIATSVKDTAAAADSAAQMTNEVVTSLTYNPPRVATSVEDTAATKIQSVFRSYLARKALLALKGLVKLQALVRGHLVRKQATATFRCLQALLTAQARARARRIKMITEPNPKDDHVKIVEVDVGVTRGSAKSMISYFNKKQTDNRYSTYHHQYSKQNRQHISPAITNMSSKSNSGHFNDFINYIPHRSPQYNPYMDKPHPSKLQFLYKPEDDRCYEYQFSPNYMANTESSKAKFRSHSAPKQRPVDTFQRQPSRRRVSIEGKSLPKAVRMERSPSLVYSTPQNYHPWTEILAQFNVQETGCWLTVDRFWK